MCAQVNAIVGEVIPTRVQHTFSQLQNFMASIAVERDYTYYFWGHADVALMASNATATFSEEIFRCAKYLPVCSRRGQLEAYDSCLPPAMPLSSQCIPCA